MSNYFLDQFNNDEVPKFFKKQSNFPALFAFWKNNLFERLIHLFVWDTEGLFEQKELEQRLLIAGFSGMTDRVDGELTPVFSSLFGPTKYQDEYTSFTWHTPIASGTCRIGVDGEIINNNAIRTSPMMLVDHYAMLLAHNDVTMIQALINARDNAVPIVNTETQLQSVKAYQNARYMGNTAVVSDPSFLGVDFKQVDQRSGYGISEIYDNRRHLLYSFYEDIGVKTNYEKSENITTVEATANNHLLLFNIDDMLESRQRGAEKVNALFGVHLSVRKSKELEELEYEHKTDLRDSTSEQSGDSATGDGEL